MPRFAQRSILIAGLAGALLAYGPARADAPRAPGIACAGAAMAWDRPDCRSLRTARRRVRSYHPAIAEFQPPMIDPGVYGAGRYVSLLVLGVGY